MPPPLSPIDNAGKAGQRLYAFAPAAATLFLLCAGSYATNLGMVPIGSNDPPPEAGFCFGAIHGKMAQAEYDSVAANQLSSR
ncbi:hypothetical protein RQ479_07335 [Mesorhizobium sp. ISC25]|uniref:hypothetical protein n=1 Tax=Mesorhizobium sp. ISC25 TaxID=3077335 RepID=UPI0035DBA7C5